MSAIDIFYPILICSTNNNTQATNVVSFTSLQPSPPIQNKPTTRNEQLLIIMIFIPILDPGDNTVQILLKLILVIILELNDDLGSIASTGFFQNDLHWSKHKTNDRSQFIPAWFRTPHSLWSCAGNNLYRKSKASRDHTSSPNDRKGSCCLFSAQWRGRTISRGTSPQSGVQWSHLHQPWWAPSSRESTKASMSTPSRSNDGRMAPYLVFGVLINDIAVELFIPARIDLLAFHLQ